ncbi:MAG: hypothetical protein COB23_04830 [Methylophaga sp.]|nr:MAG: hypothetical protein COB23_04830 [Methylophaga sp.]
MTELSPSSNSIQLWLSTVDQLTKTIEQATYKLLSVSEKDRFQSTHNQHKKREFIMGRALIRHALSQIFCMPETYWDFVEKSQAAPIVTNLPANCYFSLSHSHGFIVFAIASSPIGIDIENSDKQRDFHALADIFMNDEEISAWVENRWSADIFYRIWCAKEAYYKALPLQQQVTKSLNKIAISELIKNSDSWQLLEYRVESFVLAIVLKAKPEQVHYQSFPRVDYNAFFCKPIDTPILYL